MTPEAPAVLNVFALPSLVAALLVPLIAVAVLLIERGSRRGNGMAGFLFLFAVSSAVGFFMHSRSADSGAADLLARGSFVLGTFAYFPMLGFLDDLAERSGVERPLGIPRRWAVWSFRLLGAAVGLDAGLFGLGMRGAVWLPGLGWTFGWGAAWPAYVAISAAFLVWTAACWEGQRRYRGRIQSDQVAWLVALLLLVSGPHVLAVLVPALGIAGTTPWANVATVLGGIATLVSLVLSRDEELRRLRGTMAAPRIRWPDSAPRVSEAAAHALSHALSCQSCGAAFRTLPAGATCPLDGGAVDVGPDRLLGALVDERYRVLGLLGEGGTARVYAAERLRLGRRCALKIPWGELVRQTAMADRLLREARAATRLVSRHIVRVYDAGEVSPGLPYVAMELIEGDSLAGRLRQGGALRPSSVALLGRQVAQGLAVAHQAGVVHRDLKPSNLMMVRGADLDFVKIVDFGLAKIFETSVDEPSLTASGIVMGTPQYMAPEQVRGESVGPAADVYALGAVLYEAIAGRPPFQGDTPLLLAKHLLAEPERLPLDGAAGGPLGDLIMTLLAKKPASRPAAADTAARFEALAEGATRYESAAA